MKVERVSDQRLSWRRGVPLTHAFRCVLFFVCGSLSHDRAWSFALAFAAGYELCVVLDSYFG